jgi:iron complex outermembrane receptor protein
MKSINKILFVLSSFTLCFIFAGATSAQTGTIKGQVTSTDQKPVPNINIALEGTQLGSASNQNGNYSINNIPAGEYMLVVSGVGYAKQKESINLQHGETLTVNVTLSTSNEELQEIIVEANKVNKFSVGVSEYVSKLPIEEINNPQVYNTVSSELLKDQVVTNFEDALNNAPGVFKLWESTGRGGDGSGYYAMRGFAVQPTMMNGLPALTNGTLDPVNIERVELIKGPSGTLYGSSLISYGGLINVVTKKPNPTFGGEVSYKTGSFGLNRITADVNTPINSEEEITLRVNTAYHDQNSFQDAGFNRSLFIAPSLSYRVDDRLSFLINTEVYRSESTNPTMLFLNRSAELEYKNLNELNYDNENSYTSNGITIKNPTFNLQGQMNYRFSEEWKSQTVISRSSAKSDGYYTYLWDFASYDGMFGRFLSNQNSTTLGTDIQQNFIGDFSVAGLQNKMVIGLDYYQENVINNSTGYVLYDQITTAAPSPSISKPSADTALAQSSVNKSKTKQSIYSAYISDVINFTPQISVMASVRIDHFDNTGNVSTEDDDYTQTAFSPKVGIMYQPIDERLSLFANYMDGFKNVAPITAGNQTYTFSPEHANQWETGIKTNLLNGRFTTTLSYYNIRVDNMVRQTGPEEFIQDGENYSRGFEASITTAPLPGLNIIAGYSYNDSEIVKAGNGHYQDAGRRPEEAGPKNLVNGWASYHITNGTLKGLGIGFGGNYASKNLILNREATGVFSLPSYTVFNASIFYNTNDYRLDLKINNLTNEEYYKGWSTINPQQPRAVTASFSYKF